MKRTISLLLAVLLAVSLLPMSVLAANSAMASTLRMDSTSGTVTVTNASGSKVTVSKGMRLYSGYTIATGKSSNAYITLDGSKAIKLDASSKASVKQSGNQLEIYLVSGKLFFNVTAPLNSNQSMNIRTSTMVTGIRGSYGWVTPTAMGLMHGHVTLTCINPITGETRTVEVYSGEQVYYEFDTRQTAANPQLLEIDFVKEQIYNRHVPAFVIEEMRKDESLQIPVIRDVDTIDVPALLESYEAKAAQEAQEVARQEAQLKVQLALQDQMITESKSKTEYYFKNTSAGGGGRGATSYTVTLPAMAERTGYTITATPSAGTTTTDNVTYTVPIGDTFTYQITANAGYYTDADLLEVTENGATATVTPGVDRTVNGTVTVAVNGVYQHPTTFAALQAALDGTTAGDLIYVDQPNGIADAAGTLTVSGNKTLRIDNSSVTAGTLQFSAATDTLTVQSSTGSPLNVDTLIIGCTLTIDSGAELNVTGSGSAAATGIFDIKSGGTVTLDMSGAPAEFTNSGAITNSGNLNLNGGSIINNAGATLTNSGTLTMNPGAAGIFNYGEMINGSNATINFNSAGSLTNGNATTYASDLHDTTATLTNDGNITGTVNILNLGRFFNTETIRNGYTIVNRYQIINSGVIDNHDGSIDNGDASSGIGVGTIDNLGTIENPAGQMIYNRANSIINNTGEIKNGGTINNQGEIKNDGTISNQGAITNSGSGRITGAGTVTGSYPTP